MFKKPIKRIADFAFLSLGASSILTPSAYAISHELIDNSNLNNLLLFDTPLNLNADNLYAAHRSHSSHSSHSSHRSHYSSRTSGYTSPTYSSPTYTAPVSQSTITPTVRKSTVKTTKKDKDALANLISRVQIALMIKSYDPGAVDGIMGAKTRQALKSYQIDKNLSVTSTMTTETLTSLGISLPQ